MERHWVIKQDGEPDEIVDGEGVIGEYPIISKSSGVFVYESVCPRKAFGGSMEGFFKFKFLKGPQ